MKMKKLLAMVLCVAMVLGTMSTVAFAGDTTVAKIGEQEFSSLQAAYNSADDGDVIDLVADTTEADWQYGIKGITLNGNGKKVIVSSINQNTIDNGQMLFRSESETMPINISDVTFELCDNTMVAYVVTGTISNVTIKGGKYGINVSGAAKIENCTFEGQSGEAIYFKDEVGAPGAVVDGCTFNLKTKRVCALWSNEIFRNNTINYEGEAITGLTILANSSATVTGNTMPEDTKLEIYILDDSQGSFTLSDNNIAGSVFTDGAEISNQFENVTISDNVLSSSALEGLKKVDSSVANVVAIIGEVKYSSLAEAAQAAQTGDIIEIVSDVEVAEGETITLNGVNLESANGVTLSNKGTIEIGGECSLNLALYSGEDITFLDGAIINNSTVGGPVFVAGNVTFRGDNTFAMIYDFGTLQDNYGTTADMKWTVEEGASVTLTDTARYGLGYGDNVTINGNLAAGEALTTRDTLTDDDKSLVMHGLVAQESKGWNCNSALTINNAYVQIGSNNSFGNKPGNYGGTYTYNINNSVVDASRITFYEALSKTTFNITDSDVKMGTFMTRDADSVFTLTNSKVVSNATSNGTDEGNYNAGTLKLVNSDLTYHAPVTNTGVLTVDTNSSFTAPSITGAGKIEIDVSNYDGYADLNNIINADLKGFTGEVKAVGGNGADVKFVNGQLVVKANPTGGPISGYTREDGIWGDTKANSKESYIIKIYSGDTFMGQSILNPNKGLIDGNVHVTWSIKLDAASNTDDFWIMSWDIAPSMYCQPTHVALEVDGVEVSRSAIQLNGPDSINKIYAAITDENGKILSYATSLQNAFNKVTDGGRIELLRDVVLEKTVNYPKNVAFTIDGNGKTIKTSNGFASSDANAVLDISGGADITFENVIFDGIKDYAVMRTVNADITIDNCVFKNCKHTVDQGLLRLYGDATITNSKFIDNTCTMVITLCYDESNKDEIFVIDNCLFQNNTVSGPTVVYYADGAKCTVNDSEFIGNKVYTTGNAATLYMGVNDGITVTGNLFKDNTVTTTHATTKRVAGGVFAGYYSVEGTITNNVFVNNTATGGAARANSAVYSAESGVAGNLDGNYWDGREPVPGVDFDHESPSKADLTLENYYGEYTLDADGNVVLSDAKPVNAKSVSVNFVLNTEKSNADESYLVYDIVINSRDGHVINRLNTADLTFEISSSKVAYEITPADKITLTTDLAYPNRYMFNFKGKDNVEDTATSLKIGEVKLTGYDTFTFGVANETTNLVTATTVDDNIVDEFKGTGLVVSDVISTTIAVPTRTLKVNVEFPNAVVDNAAAYQAMKVEITGNIDGVNKTVTYDLGGNMKNDGSYVIENNDLVLNNTYTVTVSGAGYRTTRYTVTMTDSKELKFWNNVMDEEQVVEIGKDTSAVKVTYLAGDIVRDNKINIYDLSAVVSYFGTVTDRTAKDDYVKYDLNRDGVIDSKDVAYVLVSWNN